MNSNWNHVASPSSTQGNGAPSCHCVKEDLLRWKRRENSWGEPLENLLYCPQIRDTPQSLTGCLRQFFFPRWITTKSINCLLFGLSISLLLVQLAVKFVRVKERWKIKRAHSAIHAPSHCAMSFHRIIEKTLQELACYLTYCSVHFRHMHLELAREAICLRIYVLAVPLGLFPSPPSSLCWNLLFSAVTMILW